MRTLTEFRLKMGEIWSFSRELVEFTTFEVVNSEDGGKFERVCAN